MIPKRLYFNILKICNSLFVMDQFLRQRDLNQTEILGDLMIYHYGNDSSHLRHLVTYFIIAEFSND